MVKFRPRSAASHIFLSLVDVTGSWKSVPLSHRQDTTRHRQPSRKQRVIFRKNSHKLFLNSLARRAGVRLASSSSCCRLLLRLSLRLFLSSCTQTTRRETLATFRIFFYNEDFPHGCFTVIAGSFIVPLFLLHLSCVSLAL